ncbi:MAG: hypothetical protein K8R76_07790 [Candidatus Aegiribacteria sp.]|nr:hypothetical protein [Candidatus Aegiribacteria sp.]
MSISKGTLTALLMTAGLFIFSSCNSTDDSADMMDHTDTAVTVVSHPDIHGWIELKLSQSPPLLTDAGASSTWLLFEGGNLLEFSLSDSKWKAYFIEGITDILDLDILGENPIFLTENELLEFSVFDCDITHEALPEGFKPVELEVRNGNVAILGETGAVAIKSESGFEVFSPDQQLEPAGDLQLIEQDWIFRLQDSGIALLDPSVNLWQFEDTPDGYVLAASQSTLYLGSNDGIFVRTAVGEWSFHSSGHLYSDGLVLTEQGIFSVTAPDEILAESPSFIPLELISLDHFREPFWAIDDHGMTVFAELGSVETNLPYYETERVSCSLAGQNTEGMQGSAESVEDMLLSGSGTFRIYESVSVRPDPFTEFSDEGRDARRDLSSISIEEFRLVGITLDPIGGDQALVEDGSGVPYILYEGTDLAHNSHVAEITSNEVIVIQDVIINYSARGGGETSIPTIYSLRLHEEGGL